MKHRGYLCIRDVGVFVFAVEDAEREKLLKFLDERFDDGDAREAFLREIRKLGEGFLARFPFEHHVFADECADDEQKHHRNEGEKRQDTVHTPHFEDGERTEKQSVTEHHDARAEAFLNGFKVVREKGHEVANLVDAVIFLRKLSRMGEHFAADRGFHADPGAEEADTPYESAEGHQNDDEDHGQTDLVEKKLPIERSYRTVDHHLAVVHTVDDDVIKLGDLEL